MTTKTELLAVIRAKCLDCCGGSSHEVALCGSGNCPNRPFRFGRDPTPARTGLGRFGRPIPSTDSEPGDVHGEGEA